MALFEKKTGTPAGTVTVTTGNSTYSFADGAQVSVTDPRDIGSLTGHPLLQLVGGTGGAYVAPPVIGTVALKDGVLVDGSGVRVTTGGLPAVRTIGLIGASTEQNNGTAEPIGQTTYNTGVVLGGMADYGYLSWANAFLGWRQPRVTLQGGVSGDTSAMILARIPTLLADRASLPDAIICGSGLFGNDFTTISVAQGQANMQSILDAVLATGRLLIIATAQHHSGAALTGLTPVGGLTYQQYQAQQNAFLRKYAESNPNVLLLDIERITADAVTGGWRSGLSGDGLHPYQAGAAVIGNELAALLSPLCPTDHGPANALDPYNLLGTAGFMQGTSGTNSTALTGTAVPNGWTLGVASFLDARTPAGTLTNTARADGLGNEFKITLTSPGAVSLTYTLGGGTFSASDYYRAGLEVRTGSDLSGVHGIGLYCTTGFSSKSVSAHLINTSHWGIDKTAGLNIPTSVLNSRTMALKAQRRSIDSGESGNSFFMQFYFWAEAGTVYVSRGSVRKGTPSA